jgi:hypothetical protein
MPGATMPFKGFDPLGLATLGSESTLSWFRAAELKHARVAMLATTGYLVQAAGVHFPGMLSSSVSFESLSTMKPFDAWASVPDLGQQQIIGELLWSCSVCVLFTMCISWFRCLTHTFSSSKSGTIFLAEIITEAKGVHYTKGGDLPTIVFPPIEFSSVDPEKLKVQQSRELNNGRLAMISIMSFAAAANIPGSVPALTGNPMF